MTSIANYSIVRSDAESITIRDEGGPTNASVTNDAENVVQEMLTLHGLGERRLFYYDSQGDLDEIVVVSGEFAGFRRGPRDDDGGTAPRPLGKARIFERNVKHTSWEGTCPCGAEVGLWFNGGELDTTRCKCGREFSLVAIRYDVQVREPKA